MKTDKTKTTLDNTANDQNNPDEFENCRGQCGYTPWCRECKSSRKNELPDPSGSQGNQDDSNLSDD